MIAPAHFEEESDDSYRNSRLPANLGRGSEPRGVSPTLTRRSPTPPTGRAIAITGLIIDQLADGKVIERWEQYDQPLMMQQLGLA